MEHHKISPYPRYATRSDYCTEHRRYYNPYSSEIISGYSTRCPDCKRFKQLTQSVSAMIAIIIAAYLYLEYDLTPKKLERLLTDIDTKTYKVLNEIPMDQDENAFLESMLDLIK